MDRRHFLLSPAGMALYGQSPPDPVATGFIGTGNRGSYLLKTAFELPGVRVAAVCDLKPERLDRAASLAARDRPATFTDYRRLLERREIQAVFIASPCDLHVEMAIAALEAGKHVYCEKPVGITPESIGALLRAARKAKTVFCAGQQMRSDSRLRDTIAKVEQGIAGRIVMVKAQRHAGRDLDHDGPSADWFFNAARSGDVIVEMAVHNLDVCNWVIGSRPERAAGFGGALLWKDDPPGRTNMDGYTLSYDYANGVKMSFTQVFFHPDGMPGGGQSFYVYGTDGAVDLMNSTFYRRGKREPPPVLAEPRPQQHQAHLAAFFEAVRTGSKPPAGIDIGATGALTAILGREAIYRQRVMSWRDLGVEV